MQEEQKNLREEMERYKDACHKDFTALSEHSNLKGKELENRNKEKQMLDAAFKCIPILLILALKSECMELGAKVVSYEQIICCNEDTNTKLESVERTVEALKNERGKLDSELRKAGTQLIQFNEHAQGKDEQIAILKNIVNDLTTKMQSYIPFKVSSPLLYREIKSTRNWLKN